MIGIWEAKLRTCLGLIKSRNQKRLLRSPDESEITKGYSSLLILNLTANNIEGFVVKSKFWVWLVGYWVIGLMVIWLMG